jgi:hypothetical protein
LSCATPGQFKQDYAGPCGTERWPVKTGADNGAPGIALLPKLTTIAALSGPPQPSFLPASTRVKPTETMVYALKDVRVSYVRLEDDGDYHIVLVENFGATTMIGEIPYPGGCTTGSAWQCLISRARAEIDARFSLVLNQGQPTNQVVSVVGVAFWDPEHGQFGASANGIELHPVLAICFGSGCTPE